MSTTAKRALASRPGGDSTGAVPSHVACPHGAPKAKLTRSAAMRRTSAADTVAATQVAGAEERVACPIPLDSVTPPRRTTL